MSRFEIKIVAALLLIAILPLVASVMLVGQVIRVSDSVAEGQARRLAQPLESAAGTYRQLFASIKTTFKLRGELLAADPELQRAVGEADRERIKHRLGQLLVRHPAAARILVLAPNGALLARSMSKKTLSPQAHRDLQVRARMPGGHVLQAVFLVPRQIFDEFQKLGQAQRAAHQITRLKDELATYYRAVFVIMFGAVLLLATGTGLFIARRTTRRVAALASATRQVAGGDLETRVHLSSRDELGDLARAFNEMVSQIRESRERIAYLEKIGAWQEIARRLAHEIKNPLTPIQLAVQQLCSGYGGDDPKFTRLLSDARDIVTEEVDGLRRLVQAFSAFAKLPEVQPEPVQINTLIDDFLKSHAELQQAARILWTPLATSRLIQVDRMLIKHVLFNLVENAVQAAEQAGLLGSLQVALCCTVLPERRRVTLSVEDNGPGMDAEATRRVFDPYFTTKEHGTGLGLAIVKKTVLEHGGTISVWSRPGEGTRFTLTLPLA